MASEASIQSVIADLTHLQNTNKDLADQIAGLGDGISEEYPFTRLLTEKCKTAWGNNSLAQFRVRTADIRPSGYYRFSSLNRSVPDGIKSMTVPRSFLHCGIHYSRTDMIENRGPDTFVGYISDAIEQCRIGTAAGMELRLLGNGTTDANGDTMTDERVIYGAQYVVTSSGTGDTIYGQARADATPWFNSFATDITSVNGITFEKVDQMFNKTTHGKGLGPNLVMFSSTGFNRVRQLARTDRFVKDKANFDLGIPNAFSYNGATFIENKAMTSLANGGILDADMKRVFFLTVTPETMEFRIDAKDDWVLDPVLQDTGTASYYQDLWWNGQLIIKSMRNQGCFYWA